MEMMGKPNLISELTSRIERGNAEIKIDHWDCIQSMGHYDNILLTYSFKHATGERDKAQLTLRQFIQAVNHQALLYISFYCLGNRDDSNRNLKLLMECLQMCRDYPQQIQEANIGLQMENVTNGLAGLQTALNITKEKLRVNQAVDINRNGHLDPYMQLITNLQHISEDMKKIAYEFVNSKQSLEEKEGFYCFLFRALIPTCALYPFLYVARISMVKALNLRWVSEMKCSQNGVFQIQNYCKLPRNVNTGESLMISFQNVSPQLYTDQFAMRSEDQQGNLYSDIQIVSCKSKIQDQYGAMIKQLVKLINSLDEYKLLQCDVALYGIYFQYCQQFVLLIPSNQVCNEILLNAIGSFVTQCSQQKLTVDIAAFNNGRNTYTDDSERIDYQPFDDENKQSALFFASKCIGNKSSYKGSAQKAVMQAPDGKIKPLPPRNVWDQLQPSYQNSNLNLCKDNINKLINTGLKANQEKKEASSLYNQFINEFIVKEFFKYGCIGIYSLAANEYGQAMNNQIVPPLQERLNQRQFEEREVKKEEDGKQQDGRKKGRDGSSSQKPSGVIEGGVIERNRRRSRSRDKDGSGNGSGFRRGYGRGGKGMDASE